MDGGLQFHQFGAVAAQGGGGDARKAFATRLGLAAIMGFGGVMQGVHHAAFTGLRVTSGGAER